MDKILILIVIYTGLYLTGRGLQPSTMLDGILTYWFERIL